MYIDNHATIWRWRDAYQFDFAARMDWCLSSYEEANHPPVAKLAEPISLDLRAGDRLLLDASPSTDPDSDSLSYKWIHYPEAGDYWDWSWQGPVTLEGSDKAKLTVHLPKRANIRKPRTTHIILQVTDSGTPQLTRYQRVILRLLPAE